LASADGIKEADGLHSAEWFAPFNRDEKGERRKTK